MGLPLSQAADHHVAHFYESDDYLCDAMTRFAGEGLSGGESTLVLATEAHRRALLDRLQARGFDARGARSSGQLALLDAEETLATFMVDGKPNPERFRAEVGRLIAERVAVQPPQRLRVHGEMVDLLWRSENGQGALQLEELWNELGRVHSFSLLCAYSMGNFFRECASEQFLQICDQHAHVVPFEHPPADPAGLLNVALLQQRTRALESEIEHRKELERTMRDALADRRRAEQSLELVADVLAHDLLANPARMPEMLEQLLDFTRLRMAGGTELDPIPVDLAELCRHVMCQLEAAPPGFGLRLESSGDLTGTWDRERLLQLLSNVIGNAIRHGTRPASVHVRVDGNNPELVVLKIQNHGSIPESLVPTLFDPFRRILQPRVSTPRRGLGLGLFIAKQIVQAHGGGIDVSSDATEGTTVTVRLPRRPRQTR